MPVPPTATALAVPLDDVADAAAVADDAAEDALYPCSDGSPMADDMWQSRAILAAASDLETAYPGALVVADTLVYPERGNPKNRVAPDVLLAFGLATHSRSSYFLWREGKPPDWVLEVASPKTALRDLNEKRVAYAKMGVPEYWLFDPRGDVFPAKENRLQGLALAGRRYRPLPARHVDGQLAIYSKVLGLDVQVDGELMRFRGPKDGKVIPHRRETEAAAALAAARVDAETARAATEAARASTEVARRNAAERRAEAAEAQVAQLQAALQRLQGG